MQFANDSHCAQIRRRSASRCDPVGRTNSKRLAPLSGCIRKARSRRRRTSYFDSTRTQDRRTGSRLLALTPRPMKAPTLSSDGLFDQRFACEFVGSDRKSTSFPGFPAKRCGGPKASGDRCGENSVEERSGRGHEEQPDSGPGMAITKLYTTGKGVGLQLGPDRVVQDGRSAIRRSRRLQRARGPPDICRAPALTGVARLTARRSSDAGRGPWLSGAHPARGCKFASSQYPRGRAIPGRCEGRRRFAAGGWRRRGAARAD